MFRSVIATVISAIVVAANPLVSDHEPMGNKATANSMRLLKEDSSWIQFQNCQFLESLETNLPGQEEGLAVTQRSVPNPMSSSNQYAIFGGFAGPSFCASDYDGYQEFIIDLDEYLEIAVRYHQRIQEEMCESCRETCTWNDMEIDEEEEAAGDDATNDDKGRFLMDVDCDRCLNECEIIENMEANGYMDATLFIQCQMVYDTGEDGPGAQLYAGPMCSEDGSKIKIGIFTDEECTNPDLSKKVENYLVNDKGYSMRLSHALLKKTYSRDCLDCSRRNGLCRELGIGLNVMEYGELIKVDKGDDELIKVDKEDDERTEDDKEVGDSNMSNSGYERPERYTFVFTVLVLGTAALMLAQ